MVSDPSDADDNADDRGRSNHRPASRQGSRPPSEAPTHTTTRTHVIHHYGNGGRKGKQSKKARAAARRKKEAHTNSAKKMPLAVLKKEVAERETQRDKIKAEQDAHNLEIDKKYNDAVMERIKEEDLKPEYDRCFAPWFAMKEKRQDAFQKMIDEGKASEIDQKRFKEYWRAAYAKKLREFLNDYHVAAPPQRSTFAKAHHETVKEQRANIARETAATIAKLAAAKEHVEKGGTTEASLEPSLERMSLNEKLWGASTSTRP